MSFNHYSLAWELDVSSSEKLVLLALADHTNQSAECWPSIRRLSTMTGLHRSTVMRSLDRLTNRSVIDRKQSSGRVTRYRLQVVAKCDQSDDATGRTVNHVGSQGGTGVVAACDLTDSTVPPEPVNEPTMEPTINSLQKKLTIRDVDR